jgi:hypothetical protein
MEKSNIIIRIPEPCHEDWNKMLPDEKGKFCNSCNKSVFDFSNKTDMQIKDILTAHKDQKVCGHFKKSQVDRPLNLTIDLHKLPKNMSVTKMFTIALFISFGTLLFSCTDNFGKTVGEIAIMEPTKTENTQNKETIEPMMGQFVATPPDSILQIETIDPMETIEGEIQSMSYTHVAGGISIQHIAIDQTIVHPTVIDSPIVEYPTQPEERMLGMMVWQEPTIDIKEETQDSLKSIITHTIDKTSDDKIIEDVVIDLLVFPNPSKGEFTIKYDLKKRSDVLVEIVDIKGVSQRTIVNIQGQHTGKYQVPVDLSDLTNGIYFVNLSSEGKRRTQKVILEK